MPVATMRQLLEAGIHFGHQTRRWNPKMKRYIFGERNGIYIIDLQRSLRQLHKAYKAVHDCAANGGVVLFVGTKKQAREPIQREADRCGMYHVNNRWLGGMLTNFRTVQQSVSRLHDLEDQEQSGRLDTLAKKESARIRKELEKLRRDLSGIKTMRRLPDMIFVIDTRKEDIAVREARRLNIPCIGVVDTNADPDCVPFPIPGNDDAIRAINLFCKVMADAVIEGRSIAEKSGEPDVAAEMTAAAEPAAEAAPAEAAAAPAEETQQDDQAAVATAEPEAETETDQQGE